MVRKTVNLSDQDTARLRALVHQTSRTKEALLSSAATPSRRDSESATLVALIRLALDHLEELALEQGYEDLESSMTAPERAERIALSRISTARWGK